MGIIEKSRDLMLTQTKKNRAPSWLLTELSVRKGRELAKKYNVDQTLVVTSLYLAHTVFSQTWHGDIQKRHPKLSAEFVKKYLDEWKVSKDEQEIILNSIEAHHDNVPVRSKIAEVVKNAECFKFISIEGSLIWLHELGLRQVQFDEAVHKVIQKMEQKRDLLTLTDCKKEGEENRKKILNMFSTIIKENQ